MALLGKLRKAMTGGAALLGAMLGMGAGVGSPVAPQSVLAAAAEETPAAALEKLIEDYWAFELDEFPFRAEDHGAEPTRALTAVAPEDYARRAAAYEAFLGRARAVDRGSLGDDERVTADVLEFIVKHDAALSAFRSWRAPFLSDTGFHSNVVYQITSAPLRDEEDYERYLSRLKALPAYLERHTENMRIGIAEGFVQPREIMPGVMTTFELLAETPAEDHALGAPLKNLPPSIGEKAARRIVRDGDRLMRDEVLPAYRRLLAFMREQYLPAARDVVGVSATPDGAAHYAQLVKFYTSRDDVTADEIHELGLKEVARIQREMDEVIARADFDGDRAAFIEFLRTDPKFYAESPEALLREAAWIAKDVDGKLPKLFGRLPRQPYSVEPVPAAIAPNYTSGRYVGAALDADRGGQYWVNTYDLKMRPLFELPALTLHEAMPGHHLQNALAAEMENVPAFRRDFYAHAYGEGWGLYSEKLGLELDVYQTPYDDFGRLSFEMWRAARLVIDTGLHSKGWTRQQAIDYLASNTALSMRNVRAEIDRYIAWPGQALAYKIGELTILELRARAEEELGEDFNIRAFHDAVLSAGATPLDILAARIDRFIADEKRKARGE